MALFEHARNRKGFCVRSARGNSVDLDQTALKEQSDLGIHLFATQTAIILHFSNFTVL